MKLTLTDDLRQQYQDLFPACSVIPGRESDIERELQAIWKNEERCQKVAGALSILSYFVAAIHSMEASLSFDRHLQNGDLLTGGPSTYLRDGPVDGAPPWEESAIYALKLRGSRPP